MLAVFLQGMTLEEDDRQMAGAYDDVKIIQFVVKR